MTGDDEGTQRGQSLSRSDVAKMSPSERGMLVAELAAMVAESEITLGDAARLLRTAVLDMSRKDFASRVGVSPRALAQLEDGDGNPTLETLQRVFGPFGARLGLVFVPRGVRDPAGDEERQLRGRLLTTLARSRRPRGRTAAG